MKRATILLPILLLLCGLPISSVWAVANGDFNNDTHVNTTDAIFVLQASVQIRPASPDEVSRADLSGNGKMDVNDAIGILQIAVGLRPPIVTTPTIPPGPVKFVGLGDSLTQGEGDTFEGGGYPGRLIGRLSEVRPGSTVLNLGRSGWTSDDLIRGNEQGSSQLDAAVAERPTVAFVWIGSNDLYLDAKDLGNVPDEKTEAEVVAAYAQNIDTILKALREVGAVLFIALLDDQSKRPWSKDPNSSGLSEEALARQTRNVTAFNAAIRDLADRYGATVVDFFNTTIFTDPSTLFEDGYHPNPLGYDRVTDIWWAALRPLL